MAKTLIERFGFADPDRKTPLHDQICLWVHQNAEHVMSQALGDIAETDDEALFECKRANRELELLGYQPLARVIGGDYKVEWEKPIGGKQTAGFIDLCLSRVSLISTGLTEPVFLNGRGAGWLDVERQILRGLHPSTIDWGDFKEIGDRWIALHDAGITQWRDLFPQYAYSRSSLNVEVKSQIASVGELLRQIQFYRTFDKKTPWCVVSPDPRYADLIRQQGIHFVEYPRHLVNQTGQTDLF